MFRFTFMRLLALILSLLFSSASWASNAVSPRYVPQDDTSVMLNFCLFGSADGELLTGLTHDTASLEIRWMDTAESDWGDEYTVGGTDDVEAIAAIGAWVAPTAGKIRFGAIGNGCYQLQTEDTTWDDDGTSILWQITDAADAANLLDAEFEVFKDVCDLTCIEGEVSDALIAINLDHLFFQAITGTQVVDNSFGAQITSSSATADFDTFNNQTDAMEKMALRLSALGLALLGSDSGAPFTADSGTTLTIVDAALTQADTDYFTDGTAAVFVSGNISGQVRCAIGFTPAADTITFANALTQAVTTQQYFLISAPGCAPLESDEITAAVLAADASTEIATETWDTICETQGSIQCDQLLSLLGAEAFGEGDAPTDGSNWTLSTPNGVATRIVITYGTDNGDRTSISLTP